MPLTLRTFRIGSPRAPDEGLRLGVVRYPPRGIPREDYVRRDVYDLWLPILAPSRELLGQWRDGRIPLERFFVRYRAEMASSAPRQLIRLLRLVARQMPLAVGCYCADESSCHRRVLLDLICQKTSSVPTSLPQRSIR